MQFTVCSNKKAPAKHLNFMKIDLFRDAGHVFHTYQVTVNGKILGTKMNLASLPFNNVKIYASDPWFVVNSSPIPHINKCFVYFLLLIILFGC